MALESWDQQYCIQELMQSIKANESSGIRDEISPVITFIVKSTPNLKTPPLYQSCQLAHSKHQVPIVNQPTKAQQAQEGAFS